MLAVSVLTVLCENRKCEKSNPTYVLENENLAIKYLLFMSFNCVVWCALLVLIECKMFKAVE